MNCLPEGNDMGGGGGGGGDSVTHSLIGGSRAWFRRLLPHKANKSRLHMYSTKDETTNQTWPIHDTSFANRLPTCFFQVGCG